MNKAVVMTALAVALGSGANAAEPTLDRIELPPGFQIDIYAEGVSNARQMARGDNGTLFIGTRKAGKVYAVVDTDGDQRADQVHTIARGLTMPSGVAFRDGALYVGAVSTIYRYDNIEAQLEDPPKPVVVNDSFPDDKHHGWKYLGFGPDGKLYVPVGAPCNICDKPGYSAIKRMNADGSEVEDFALGVRNSVGMAWHPDTDELWFSDNGRDLLGDDIPPCELNHAPRQGMHFGFPHCHGGVVEDDEYADGHSCSEFTPPARALGAHVAPLGMTFYSGSMFPAEFKNQIFVTEHGSWNRSKKVGYRVMVARLDGDEVIDYQPFASGWLIGEKNWGRPNDVLVMPDGALLISDDQSGVIYRVHYEG
jgi:glucose/arabinose dehydrogenase